MLRCVHLLKAYIFLKIRELKAVLGIRIRSDPDLLAGSGSDPPKGAYY
jgi:hypothetical protein